MCGIYTIAALIYKEQNSFEREKKRIGRADIGYFVLFCFSIFNVSLGLLVEL